MSNTDPLGGIWISEVGSKLELKVNGSVLSGTFSHKGETVPIFGVVEGASQDPLAPRPLSFSAYWPGGIDYKPSVTSYTGQYQYSPKLKAFFIVTIFLFSEGTSVEHNYKAVTVGHDNFHRD